MRKRFIAGVVGAIGIVMTVLLGGSFASASTGPAVASPEQAGYAVTGGQFRDVHASVYLRNAATYSSELAGFGNSVQLWSSKYVIILGVSDSTITAPYSPALAVYDTATKTLHCSTAAATPCPGTPKNWTDGSVSYAHSQTVRESLYYNKATGNVTATVVAADGSASSASFDAGTVSFNQARVGNETSAVGPWGLGGTFTPPASTTLWARWSNAGITTYRGGRYSLSGWFVASRINMTGAGSVVQANASALSNGGANFTTSLQP